MRPAREAAAALAGVGGGDQAAAAAAGHAHTGLWTTPTPYLFLGFAMMMALIAAALLILVCARRKPSSSGLSRRWSGAAESDASAWGMVLVPLDREPKVVVIMAGDRMPSFIASAKPFAAFPALTAAAGEPSKADVA
jgi:hypothetical protein